MSDRPLSIDLVIGSGRVGGAEGQAVELAVGLCGLGHDVAVVLLEGVGPHAERLADLYIPATTVGFGGLSMSRVPGVPTKNTLRTFPRLIGHRRRTHSRRPQVSHAFLDGAIAVGPLLDIGSGQRPVRVAGVRGLSDQNPFTKRLFNHNVRRADAVVCNAPHLVLEMTRDFGVDASLVHWIPNGVGRSERTANVTVDPPTAVVVANYHPYKGHDTLLDALARLDGAPRVRACGTGAERHRIAGRISELGLTDRVTLVEPPADVPAELAAAQFAIHPSVTEGLSNAILEQLAAGLPVIACDVGGNPALIEHEVNGLLVPPDDPAALARAIARMTVDVELRSRMSVAARASADRFSWPACLAAHVELYRALLAARSSRG